ncbi:uncharacterized protein EDB91DRAFT_314018 [Suillus paluster]|uniref:uncharacterized protein n=1 Tax=Suillus paluster TaxID=48578 RepID=UPI001B86F280|nr:uncharacterized protein EDB91DRAFT_314018 [Suillus paluster]KAG1741772.1 hypothetical protein EDB91DRAFT_314018 [Suillus paluster]
MAVLAPQDWQPPRDLTTSMDNSIPRQRSSPSNDSQPNIPTQPYPYPVQQQPHGSWTPSPQAQPFYPSYYQQNQQQINYPTTTQNPYFDPQANAQLAQWAYQQMMYSQQQQQIHAQRTTTQPPEYFNPSQLFSPFPSGTPPPHSHYPAPQQAQRSLSSDAAQYSGFHPYRRPNNTRSQDHPEWRTQPPYARGEASASTTSVNSSSSHGAATSRQRTTSIQGQQSRSRNPPPIETPRARTGSGSSSTGSRPTPHPHHRTTSSSSTNSSTPRPSASTATSRSSTSTATTPATASSSSHARPVRPSPLSQGTYTAAEKRMSRDDSDLAAILEGTSIGAKTGGIKGRLRRALSLNAAQALQEEEETPVAGGSTSKDPPTTTPPDADAVSTATVQTKKKGRAASLFNSRLNASTDNISLSSTMSSASVVIRKIGSIGKLARRNSLAGITSLFKDKNKNNEGAEDSGGKKKKKKDAKGEVVAPSVSHAVAELDRGEWSAPEMSGLSPAAKLARQHTLKSNAEAAAAAKVRVEARAEQQPAQVNGTHVPAAWEKNTATRAGESSARVAEDGTRVVVEEDEESDDGHAYVPQPGQNFISDGWDDDEVWDEDGEEDVTIRVGMSADHQGEDEEVVAWATNIRRSVERHRTPAKGILKGADNYTQEVYNGESVVNPAFSRVRSNSDNSHPGQGSELGPLARMPSPDPDHIDGLHRHPSHSSTGGTSFPSPLNPSDVSPDKENQNQKEKEKGIFTLSNSSAPALSTIPTNPPTLTHRSATTPAKRLVFANNLSVYDTFSSTVYDRRSEPATWSRLTPALAQRIKEELNSYKMEEMEVHACSRMHTQFFI